MIQWLTNGFYDTLIAIIDLLPEVDPLTVPDGVMDGVQSIFAFVGWVMPYNLYSPLLLFILSLTAFRIVYAIYLNFKKN